MYKNIMNNNILVVYFIIALILSLIMGLNSEFDAHPDEKGQFVTAKYYSENTIPPKVDNTLPQELFQLGGYPRVANYGLELFLAGKYMSILDFFLQAEDYILARMFNLTLFLILIILVLKRIMKNKNVINIFTILLCIPQVWYIFSYTNEDAFPLFLTLLIAYILTKEDNMVDTLFIRKSRYNKKSILAVIILGLLIGLISISKRNYMVYSLLFPIYLFIRYADIETLKKPIKLLRDNLSIILKIAAIYLVALSIVISHKTMIYVINGPNIDEKRLALREEFGVYSHKPSTAQTNIENFAEGGYLIKKDVEYYEMFLPPYLWAFKKSATFIGVYGYVSEYSNGLFYVVFFTIYLLLIAYVFFSVKNKTKKDYLLIIFLISFILSAIFVSTIHSWVKDFQPQGRYIFSIISILMLTLYHMKDRVNIYIYNGFITLLFILGLYSFIFVGLINS